MLKFHPGTWFSQDPSVNQHQLLTCTYITVMYMYSWLAHFQAVPYNNSDCCRSTHPWLADLISNVPHLLWNLNACIQLFNISTCYMQIYYLMSNYYFPLLLDFRHTSFPAVASNARSVSPLGVLRLLFSLPGVFLPQTVTGLASPFHSDAASTQPPPRRLR